MSAPTVFVELIEEKWLPFADWSARLTDEDFDGQEHVTAAYNAYLDNFQPFRILITASNGEPLFRSTERYRDERDARHAIELAFGAGSTVVLQQAGMDDVTLRVAAG